MSDESHEDDAEDDAADDAEAHRFYAVDANSSTWELIDLERRSADQEEEMLRRAYAAAYHWDRALGRSGENEARASWLLSRVQVLVGQPALSLRYADRCLAVCERHGVGDFDLAFAHEARGRALRVLGRSEEAAAAWSSARVVPIEDAEDRQHLEEELTAP